MSEGSRCRLVKKEAPVPEGIWVLAPRSVFRYRLHLLIWPASLSLPGVRASTQQLYLVLPSFKAGRGSLWTLEHDCWPDSGIAIPILSGF